MTHCSFPCRFSPLDNWRCLKHNALSKKKICLINSEKYASWTRQLTKQENVHHLNCCGHHQALYDELDKRAFAADVYFVIAGSLTWAWFVNWIKILCIKCSFDFVWSMDMPVRWSLEFCCALFWDFCNQVAWKRSEVCIMQTWLVTWISVASIQVTNHAHIIIIIILFFNIFYIALFSN